MRIQEMKFGIGLRSKKISCIQTQCPTSPKIRKFILSFLVYLLACPVLLVGVPPPSAQQNTIDSLNTLLKTATHDTTRLGILNEFIESENDDKIWQPYNEQMKFLAEKLAQSSNKEIKAKGKKVLLMPSTTSVLFTIIKVR